MGGPFDAITDTIFADKSVLTEDYQPDEILERDEEIEEYRNALKDVLFGRSPQNIFLYGKAGLGKTAVTNYMMDALTEEIQQRPEADALHVHEQNCNGKTVFMVVRALVNDLRGPDGETFPKRGLGTGDAFGALYEELDTTGGTHLVVFDEIDHLDDVDTLLYELPRARSIGHITDSRVGVIGISNNYTFRQQLSAKVKDTLMETEISFSPYSADELRAILEERAENALKDDGYDSSAIAMAAALAARDMGNARQAIDLLRVGAEVAENQGEFRVTDEHIERARERVQRGRLSDKIRDQTTHAQLVLETLAHLEDDGETPARAKEIYELYQNVAESWANEPLTTVRSVHSHLSDLRMLGFLKRYERNEGLSGGQYYEFELDDLDPELVFDTREDIEDVAGDS
ncbi:MULTISPECIES: orc1/cdc6 family replication initiation protein [Halomicrobium]|uniref:ORC1-type DNA replication protein n=2 Tax=Halomicrobium mukohataei TaxID=57705 RepID=C7P4A6_HALMD|nr:MULTISPECIES: orc1/cdc6 family replication initiation protein [Halomicrobium]ACV47928.1 orc1/cdc6 family replication initiation protein [Halomicrobium mukohataei DSM 12286]QCD66367.1 cell division control protein Cdc6 [Halomicrobium mukohataei]QFR21172.1 AAA family ATPase [Halomicrobium sp. ZPS1]